jgi:hypothetical protein
MEKMGPAESIPEMGGEGIKKNNGGDEFNLIYFKNFCKCHSVPPEQQ